MVSEGTEALVNSLRWVCLRSCALLCPLHSATVQNTLAAWCASALTRRRREEMEKSASLREKLSAQQQSMAVIDRERESLKRELEHSKRDQQNTLQMMSR